MLLDSNIIIYAGLGGQPRLDDFLSKGQFGFASITKIEVLGYHRLTPASLATLQDLFTVLDEYPLTPEIVSLAMSLRQAKRMSLGDAIIAATAMHHDLTLITRNMADFAHIAELRVIDPLA